MPRLNGARQGLTGSQQVLLTDAEPGQRAFYEALGYTETHDVGDGSSLRAFVRFT